MRLYRSIKICALILVCLLTGRIPLWADPVISVASADIQATATVVPGVGMAFDDYDVEFDVSPELVRVMYPSRSGVLLNLDCGDSCLTLGNSFDDSVGCEGPGEMFIEIPEALFDDGYGDRRVVLTLVYTEN